MTEATDRVKEMLTWAGIPVRSVTEDPEPRPLVPHINDIHRNIDGSWWMFDGQEWFFVGRVS